MCKVIISFVVDTAGNVKNLKTLGRKRGYVVEEEATRVIQSTNGLWEPAMFYDAKMEQRLRYPIHICFH